MHTQKGPLHYILYGVAAILIASAWMSVGELILAIILAVAACVMGVSAMYFRSLTVSDEGEWLSKRFGPIPLFRKPIAYSRITSVEPGGSFYIDGWGIHYAPGRGWTYNFWGFGCAVVHLGGTIIRIGSDDVEKLVDFLNSRIKSSHG